MKNSVFEIGLGEGCVYLVDFWDLYIFRNNSMSGKHGFPLISQMPLPRSQRWESILCLININIFNSVWRDNIDSSIINMSLNQFILFQVLINCICWVINWRFDVVLIFIIWRLKLLVSNVLIVPGVLLVIIFCLQIRLLMDQTEANVVFKLCNSEIKLIFIFVLWFAQFSE